jgi:histidinol-phosphate aminotransferase
MRAARGIVRLAARGVRKLEPYLPGKPVEELEREYGVRDAIKLASNENPLGPPAQAIAAIQRDAARAHFYPDGSGYRLRQALATHLAVDADQVVLGNGSNDLLVLIAETFLTPRTEAVYSEFAFIVYKLAVQATGATARIAAANPPGGAQPYGHDLAALRSLVTKLTRVVFIANPNNPTGTWLETAELRRFVDDLPAHVIVVLDEAYAEYASSADDSRTLDWLRDTPNLIITRTFSKIYALAGLRVGYAVCSPPIAELLNRIRQPFNVNLLGQAAALAALGDEAHVVRSRELNREGLAQLRAGLSQLGIGVAPSAGNFVFADLGRPAASYYEALLRAGVIVRPLANYGLPRHLRISVGLPEHNARFLDAMRLALQCSPERA